MLKKARQIIIKMIRVWDNIHGIRLLDAQYFGTMQHTLFLRIIKFCVSEIGDKVIDKAGYRYGVGIILVNDNRQVFFAKRIGMSAWQFPQGGMKFNETPLETMFRELKEEIGLNPNDVQVISSTRRWLRYRLPHRLVRHYAKPLCIGQKQKWFLLRLANQNALIDLGGNEDPEFDSWAWVSYWYPLRQVVTFKRRVYVMALKEFAKIVLTKRFWEEGDGSYMEAK